VGNKQIFLKALTYGSSDARLARGTLLTYYTTIILLKKTTSAKILTVDRIYLFIYYVIRTKVHEKMKRKKMQKKTQKNTNQRKHTKIQKNT